MRHLLFSSLTLATLLAQSVAVRAADPLAVELIAADNSLAGWQYEPEPPRGWTVQDGALMAASDATPLVAGWTWGEFELAFGWTGLWTLELLPVGEGSAWKIALGEGESATYLEVNGDRTEVKQPIESRSDGEPHRTIVRRFGERLVLEIDGRRAASCSVDASQRVLQLAGQGKLSQLTLDEPLGEPLFNGRDTTGWKVTSGKAWNVVAGELRGGGGSNYLRTEEEFANFVLALEYKQAAGGNSGIGLRTPDGGWPSGDGMELQFYDESAGTLLNKHSTAALYGNVEPLARADRGDVWNRVVVRAEGHLVSMWVNGRLVQHANTRLCPELKYRNLRGWVGVQNHQDPTRVRNVLLRRLPDGEGPSAWHAPRPEPASRRVLEPLMNSERLAEDRAARGGSTIVTLAPQGARTVELNGPGAMTAMSGTWGDSRVELTIDGAPALACPLAELAEKVHAFAASAGQVVFYLPYRSAAQVTLAAGSEPLELRLDHVAVPDDAVPESWANGPGASCERGLISALAYRRQQLESGRHRLGDPVETAEGADESLEPAEKLVVAVPEGRGVVKRLTLGVPHEFLRDDTLWIEVYADGHDTPAIAAPARLMFPGLTTSKYENFAVTDEQGLVSLLGMPFGAGLRVELSNRSERPVRNLRCRLAVDRAAWRIAASIDAGLRLRGTYQTADEASQLDLNGVGRVVGLVVDRMEEATAFPAIESLSIDGQAADQAGSADSAFGFWGLPAAEGDSLGPLSGRAGTIAWRWFLNAPPKCEQSFMLRWKSENRPKACLLLYYGR